MKEIYLIHQPISPGAIHVEDGIIKSAPKGLSNFIGQSFLTLEKALQINRIRYLLEKVEDDIF